MDENLSRFNDSRERRRSQLERYNNLYDVKMFLMFFGLEDCGIVAELTMENESVMDNDLHLFC